MHYLCIVLAREDVSSATHVCCQLVYILDTFDRSLHHLRIAEVAQNELIRRGLLEFMFLDIRAANPVPFTLQSPDEMSAFIKKCGESGEGPKCQPVAVATVHAEIGFARNWPNWYMISSS